MWVNNSERWVGREFQFSLLSSALVQSLPQLPALLSQHFRPLQIWGQQCSSAVVFEVLDEQFFSDPPSSPLEFFTYPAFPTVVLRFNPYSKTLLRNQA